MSKKKQPQHTGETSDLATLIGRDINRSSFEIKCKFELNDVHKTALQLMTLDKTKIVFIDGPAGSNKTYLSVMAGLTLLAEKKVSNIVYIRSVVESASKSIGALPGEIEDKFRPWSIPLMEKLDELIPKTASFNLLKEDQIKCIPVNFVRGMTFHNSFVIVDEIQNFDLKEATTILTRFGQNSKYAVVGDSKQSDIGSKSGFAQILKAFDDEEC